MLVPGFREVLGKSAEGRPVVQVILRGAEGKDVKEHAGFDWKLAVWDMHLLFHSPILPVAGVVPKQLLNAGDEGDAVRASST
jgi:hypothetical protein